MSGVLFGGSRTALIGTNLRNCPAVIDRTERMNAADEERPSRLNSGAEKPRYSPNAADEAVDCRVSGKSGSSITALSKYSAHCFSRSTVGRARDDVSKYTDKVPSAPAVSARRSSLRESTCARYFSSSVQSSASDTSAYFVAMCS